MAWADHDRFTTLLRQAALILEASRLAAASVVSIMVMAIVKADIQVLEVGASTLELTATAGKRVASGSCQAFEALVVEVSKQVGLEAVMAYIKALAIQVARRTWEPGA